MCPNWRPFTGRVGGPSTPNVNPGCAYRAKTVPILTKFWIFLGGDSSNRAFWTDFESEAQSSAHSHHILNFLLAKFHLDRFIASPLRGEKNPTSASTFCGGHKILPPRVVQLFNDTRVSYETRSCFLSHIADLQTKKTDGIDRLQYPASLRARCSTGAHGNNFNRYNSPASVRSLQLH